MMHHVALNYDLSGLSASSTGNEINDIIFKNGLNKNSPATVTSGSVTRVTDLNTLYNVSNPSNALPVDYLIITHPSLFNSGNLTTIANWRRDHNGYDVAIIQADNVLYNKYTGPNYQDIRDYISDVFHYGRANHTGDNHLGYICLVGDAYTDAPTQAEMVPSSQEAYVDMYDLDYDGIAESNLAAGSDYYYACVYGSDNLQDVMYGRLSVGNETELSNVVAKITSYESSSSGSWQNNITFVTHYPWFFDEDAYIAIKKLRHLHGRGKGMNQGGLCEA